ncbi:MAG TPA: M23 family metallopeptidase [Vicinamibacterales bacterium]|nr:M23 family metallopeptidase [Vicinamibacterales bacterium]
MRAPTLKARRYSVVVITNPATGVVRRFTIRLRFVLAAAACVVTLPVLIGLGAMWSAQANLSELQSANARLQMENDSFREATGELAAQVSSLQSAVDQIGAQVEVDPEVDRAMSRLPPRVRERAMGGATSSIAGPVLSGAFGSPDNAFGVLRDVLGLIERRLASVQTGVERRHALASATPSIWPIAGWLSSGFGNRRDPFTGGGDFHPGLDISGDHGQQIQAPADGVVTGASYNGNYGNLITIDHGFGLTTRYGHLSRFAVTTGEAVRRGQIIGYVGSTGRSTSPHLHYEVLVNGRLTNPLRLLAR